MFQLVLVPLDGSSFSEFALAPGLEIARRSKARIELLTVSDSLPADPTELDEEAVREDPARRYVEAKVEEIRERWEEAPVTRSVYRGPVAECIQSRARESGADIVVMASHGRGELSRLWLGSVTDEFIRHAPCPVLVIRPQEDQESIVDKGFRGERILVPIDRTDVSATILEPVVELGKLFDARVRLVTSVSYPSEKIHPYLTQASRLDDQWLREATAEARRRLDSLATRIRATGLKAEVEVGRSESPAPWILKQGEEWDADLIAMGTHGRGGIPRTVLGSVADKVVRGSTLPVLLHRPEEEEEE